jgi:hypothetical protein
VCRLGVHFGNHRLELRRRRVMAKRAHHGPMASSKTRNWFGSSFNTGFRRGAGPAFVSTESLPIVDYGIPF